MQAIKKTLHKFRVYSTKNPTFIGIYYHEVQINQHINLEKSTGLTNKLTHKIQNKKTSPHSHVFYLHHSFSKYKCLTNICILFNISNKTIFKVNGTNTQKSFQNYRTITEI